MQDKKIETTEVVKIRLWSTLKNMFAAANEQTLDGKIRLALEQWLENQEGSQEIKECPSTANNTASTQAQSGQRA